jgi:hypothetical protein
MIEYITMNGNYGCIPDNSESFETYEDACEYLITLFELDENLAKTLVDTGYLDLPSSIFGADYCEIAKSIR